LNGPKDNQALGTLRFQMEVLKKQAGGLQMALEVAANICNDPEQDLDASGSDFFFEIALAANTTLTSPSSDPETRTARPPPWP
jgi:hypothetical protein